MTMLAFKFSYMLNVISLMRQETSAMLQKAAAITAYAVLLSICSFAVI